VAGGSCRRTRPQTPQAPSEGRVPRHPPEQRPCPFGLCRFCRGPRASTAFAAAAPAAASCASALRCRTAPPWSASALASQRCARGVLGARTVRVRGERGLLLPRLSGPVERPFGFPLSSNSHVSRQLSEEPETAPFVKDQQSRAAPPLLVHLGSPRPVEAVRRDRSLRRNGAAERGGARGDHCSSSLRERGWPDALDMSR
jgi:hypothetical protein